MTCDMRKSETAIASPASPHHCLWINLNTNRRLLFAEVLLACSAELEFDDRSDDVRKFYQPLAVTG